MPNTCGFSVVLVAKLTQYLTKASCYVAAITPRQMQYVIKAAVLPPQIMAIVKIKKQVGLQPNNNKLLLQQ